MEANCFHLDPGPPGSKWKQFASILPYVVGPAGSARLIAGLPRSAHITDALASFHWRLLFTELCTCRTRRRHPISQSSISSHLVVRGTLVCFSWSVFHATITTSVSEKTENLPLSVILPGLSSLSSYILL